MAAAVMVSAEVTMLDGQMKKVPAIRRSHGRGCHSPENTPIGRRLAGEGLSKPVVMNLSRVRYHNSQQSNLATSSFFSTNPRRMTDRSLHRRSPSNWTTRRLGFVCVNRDCSTAGCSAGMPVINVPGTKVSDQPAESKANIAVQRNRGGSSTTALTILAPAYAGNCIVLGRFSRRRVPGVCFRRVNRTSARSTRPIPTMRGDSTSHQPMPTAPLDPCRIMEHGSVLGCERQAAHFFS